MDTGSEGTHSVRMDTAPEVTHSAPPGGDDRQKVANALRKHPGVLLSTRRCLESCGWPPDDFFAAAVIGVSVEMWKVNNVAVVRILVRSGEMTKVTTAKNEFNGGVWFFVGPPPNGFVPTAAGTYDLGGFLRLGQASKRPKTSHKESSLGSVFEPDRDDLSESDRDDSSDGDGPSSSDTGESEAPDDASPARDGLDTAPDTRGRRSRRAAARNNARGAGLQAARALADGRRRTREERGREGAASRRRSLQTETDESRRPPPPARRRVL